VPRQAVGGGGALDVGPTRPPDGHGQDDRLIAGLLTDVERRRHGIVVGQPQWRAVGEDADNPPDPDLPGPQQVALQFDLGEPPRVRRQRLTARLDVPLQIAILLLEMLRLEEQPFGLDDLVGDGHVSTQI